MPNEIENTEMQSTTHGNVHGSTSALVAIIACQLALLVMVVA
jgi:hypothetical protein